MRQVQALNSEIDGLNDDLDEASCSRRCPLPAADAAAAAAAAAAVVGAAAAL